MRAAACHESGKPLPIEHVDLDGLQAGEEQLETLSQQEAALKAAIEQLKRAVEARLRAL